MRTLLLVTLVLLASSAAADDPVQGFSIDRFNTIAVAPSQVSQIYTNPNLSSMEDVDLSPENQIRLFEEYSDNLCRMLVEKSKGKIRFLCYDEIRALLNDTRTWDDFNHYFSGEGKIYGETSRLFAEKLQADGVITSSLLFSYYKQSNNKHIIEAYLEWDLIDLITGQKVAGDNYSHSTKISEQDPDLVKAEYNCFEETSGRFIDYFVNLCGF